MSSELNVCRKISTGREEYYMIGICILWQAAWQNVAGITIGINYPLNDGFIRLLWVGYWRPDTATINDQ